MGARLGSSEITKCEKRSNSPISTCAWEPLRLAYFPGRARRHAARKASQVRAKSFSFECCVGICSGFKVISRPSCRVHRLRTTEMLIKTRSLTGSVELGFTKKGRGTSLSSLLIPHGTKSRPQDVGGSSPPSPMTPNSGSIPQNPTNALSGN